MRHRILSVVAAAALAAGGTACGNLTDINSNPNGPVAVPAPNILPAALQSLLTDNIFNTGMNVRYGGLWAQHFAEIQYRDEDRYLVRPGVTGGWNFYRESVEDFQRMIDGGIATGNPNWEAVGRIMKSYAFSVMTEAMGDIPYTDALKGDSMLQPTYDKQQDIYKALFADLTKASQQINPAGVGFTGGDLIYGGDMDQWRRLANSLRLRLAIHIQKADPATAQTEAAAAVAAGVFTSNDDNAGLRYLSASPNRNPIYDNHLARDDYGMSKTLVDSLLSWSDPRLPVYAKPSKADTTGKTYRGLRNGLNNSAGPPLDSISRFGVYWRETPNAPMYFMSYAEVLLLEAEAAERGWIAGNPATLYADGIRASMEQYGVADADITTYLATSRVTYAGGSAGLTQVAYQLWLALYMNGMEVWTEWRRTQVPNLTVGPDAVKNAGMVNAIPERMPYDDQEEVLNQTNVEAAVAAQHLGASNNLFAPLWFTGRQ